MEKEELEKALVKKRIFPISGAINTDLILRMERALLEMLLESHTQKANLIIDSWGGDVDSALCGFDIIKSLPFEVHATVVGDCHSAALTLLAACPNEGRKATKHSKFIFHAMKFEPSFKSTEDIEEQMKIRLEQYYIVFNDVMEVQQKAYGISKQELLEMRNNGEKYNIRLTAEQAKEKGIIYEIVEKLNFFTPAS